MWANDFALTYGVVLALVGGAGIGVGVMALALLRTMARFQRQLRADRAARAVRETRDFIARERAVWDAIASSRRPSGLQQRITIPDQQLRRPH